MAKNAKPEESKPSGPNLPKLEEEILTFWEQGKIFQKSVDARPAENAYVFYDGPPYATGLPHIGHLLASAIKDLVPRYHTMKGKRVERRFGWDCHGLPIEVLVEKELGLKSRKDIEKLGIQKFNDTCRSTVLRYVNEWQKTITRFGRWVDFENDYKTMDPTFMESALWVFSELYKKGLVYKAFRSSLYCTRCETPLSKMETTMDDSYRDVEDPSVSVVFELSDEPNTFFLAWTTTPWTLSANTALAVNAEAEYVTVELIKGEEGWIGRKLILAKDRVSQVFDEDTYRVLATTTGADLVGKHYVPIQEFLHPEGEAYRVVTANFVSLEDGTGIVHIAPAFGEEDFELSKKENLPVVLTINDAGLFLPEVTPWAGQHVKAADPSIIATLKKDGKLLKTETITHSYPFCWRCNNPLIYKVQDSWYIKVEAVKDGMLSTNEKIHWIPEHLKHGRFHQGIETAPDWGVSRSRYWGIPVPVWHCDRCDNERVVGSLDEIEQLSGQRPTDLHRPAIDTVAWACSCGGTFTRVPEVCDVWFDSGCMPYGQVHYPFENKEKFEATFPADFITEYVGQTRGWFYYLHVLSNALFGKPAFTNVVNTGILLAPDGAKISKSKGNATDVQILFDTYGSDAIRLWLLSPTILQGEEVRFDEQAIGEQMRKVLLPLWNVFTFFALYAPKEGTIPAGASTNVLDHWIFARLAEMKRDIDAGMESYELWRAVRPITEFVNDLSTWYVRRSRDRFKSDNIADRDDALRTLLQVLTVTTKLLAPFAPFLSEAIHQRLKPWNSEARESVHLEDWPVHEEKHINEGLLLEMSLARRVIEIGHALRAQEKLKVRQPLATVWVETLEVPPSVRSMILDELNVKAWGDGVIPSSEAIKKITDEAGTSLAFDTAMTEELVLEGLRREFVRQVNALRKKQGLTISDTVKITFATESEVLLKLFVNEKENILHDTIGKALEVGRGGEEMKVNGEDVSVALKKVKA